MAPWRDAVNHDILMTKSEDADSVTKPEKSAVTKNLLKSRNIGAISLIALITWLSYLFDLPLLLFPEFGALSNVVITRPEHIWARSPFHLALVPALTGCIGVLVLQFFGNGVFPVLLVLSASLLLLNFLRSPILPALSSGLIPLVLGIPSWTYPLSVFLSCTILAIIAYVRTRQLKISISKKPTFQLLAGGWQYNSYHLLVFFGFIAGIARIADISHRSIILFPPLAVLGFEVLLHTGQHPWRRSPMTFVFIFFLCATGGYLAFRLCGHSVFGVAIAVSIAICIILWRNLYVPPAIAVSILPFVMSKVSPVFPLEITFSVIALIIVAMARDWLPGKIKHGHF